MENCVKMKEKKERKKDKKERKKESNRTAEFIRDKTREMRMQLKKRKIDKTNEEEGGTKKERKK